MNIDRIQKTVSNLLKKSLRREKPFSDDTLVFFADISQSYYEKGPDFIHLSKTDAVTFCDNVAEKFQKFDLATVMATYDDLASTDDTRFMSLASIAIEIKSYLKARARVKKKLAAKDKPPAEVSDFLFSDNFERVGIFEKDRLLFNDGKASQLNLDRNFWKAFDKWYAKNRKALLKKPNITKGSGNVFKDLNVETPEHLKEEIAGEVAALREKEEFEVNERFKHKLSAGDKAKIRVMQEAGEPGHVRLGSVELTEVDAPPMRDGLHPQHT